LFLNHSLDLLRQLSRHLDRIDALDIGIQPLPLGHPAPLRVDHRDEPFEDLAGTRFDGFVIVVKVQEVTVRAALGSEALLKKS
jgi:hypothetical protein